MSLARLMRICGVAIAMVAVGAPAVDAKPPKKAASSRKKPKQKAKTAKPTPAPPVLNDAPADVAAEIDAIAEEPILEEDGGDEVEWSGPTSGEISRLHIRDPKAVGEAFPGLQHWTHPIVRADVLDAKFPGGEFGAPRKGVPKSRGCGGHCGVDLHAERGRAIVAVAAGVLVRVDRRSSGGDGLSGRHVRIRHADGTFTTYMHLDSIVDGIEVGDHVSGGQQLGTLGSTGVSSGVAHLHFELELPSKQDGGTGDHQRGYTRWIDAAPFLRQSRVIQRAIRRRAAKPTS